MKRDRVLDTIAFLGLGLYLTLAAASFFTFVKPSLAGTNGWRVYADSNVYMDTAAYIRDQDDLLAAAALLSFARNLILPAAVALVLGTADNIAIFNVLIFCGCLLVLARTFPRFQWRIFLPIVLASPTTYEALLTLNKEIFTFACAVAVSRWFRTRSAALAGALILLSTALRWEQALVLICFLVFVGLKVSPGRAALLLLLTISIGYPYAVAGVDVHNDVLESSSSDFYTHLNTLQNYGLYFLIALPKLLIALLSQVVRFWTPLLDSDRLHDLPTGPFVLIDQVCMCLVAFAAWRRGVWTRSSPIAYFCLVYCLIFLAAPENSPRYLYMLFVLLAITLSAPDLRALRIASRKTLDPPGEPSTGWRLLAMVKSSGRLPGLSRHSLEGHRPEGEMVTSTR